MSGSNEVSGSGGYGIEVNAAGAVFHPSVTGNTVSLSHLDGIEVNAAGDVDTPTVTGNTVSRWRRTRHRGERRPTTLSDPTVSDNSANGNGSSRYSDQCRRWQ